MMEIQETTEPEIQKKERPYRYVGGLKKEIEALRFLIELPYIASQNNNSPVGILMYGPPGCGKTLIAREMSKAMGGCFFKVIQGPELMSKYVGEAEKQLREVIEECQFESQKNGLPSILFFDECDAVLTNRDLCGSQFEIRFVNQFLCLLRGFDGRGKLIVIAATNRPHVLDPALKTSGRFGKEIQIGAPDSEGRAEIIQIAMEKTKQEYSIADISLEQIKELASHTEGYNGSDIDGLFQEAKDIMLRRCYFIDEEGEFQKRQELILTFADLFLAKDQYVPHYKRILH